MHAREDARADLMRVRHRPSKLLLRQGIGRPAWRDSPTGARPRLRRRCGLSGGRLQPPHMRLRHGRPVCGQRGDYVTDNPPTYEHAEMADVIDRDGFHVGVVGHRARARDDDV